MKKITSKKPFYANTGRVTHDTYGYAMVVCENKYNKKLFIRLSDENSQWTHQMIWVNPNRLSPSFSIN